MICRDRFLQYTTYQRGEPVGGCSWSMSNDKVKLEFGRQPEDERFEATDAAGDSNSSSSAKAEPRRRGKNQFEG